MDQQNEGKNENEMAKKRKLNEDQNLEEIKKRPKLCIHPRGLPIELLNELFSALSMVNALEILAKMPNFVLAKNVRKMISSVKMTMKNNKWNIVDCGPELAISSTGFVVKHRPDELNCVRAILPIPKLFLVARCPSIAYFEVEIPFLNKFTCIGFCTQQFPLEGDWLGNRNESNSIGILSKTGIYIEGAFNKFENPAESYNLFGNVIGFGIINSSGNSTLFKCFATCNGQLLGMAKLPPKFAHLRLFPAINLCYIGDLIRANFGQDEWRFNPDQLHQ